MQVLHFYKLIIIPDDTPYPVCLCVFFFFIQQLPYFLSSQVKQAVIWALQSGYRHIDCAAIYGNEVEIGEALQETLGPDKVKQLKNFNITFVSDFVLYIIVCTPGPETRGCVHHIQAVEQPTSPGRCGAVSLEDPEGPEAGISGPLPHPLALCIPVSSTFAQV